jgi:hypothetical protein
MLPCPTLHHANVWWHKCPNVIVVSSHSLVLKQCHMSLRSKARFFETCTTGSLHAGYLKHYPFLNCIFFQIRFQIFKSILFRSILYKNNHIEIVLWWKDWSQFSIKLSMAMRGLTAYFDSDWVSRGTWSTCIRLTSFAAPHWTYDFHRYNVIHYFYVTTHFQLPSLRRTKGSSICETVSATMFYFYSTLRFTDDEFASRSTYIRPQLKMDAKRFRIEYNQSSTVRKLSHARSSNLRGKVNDYCDNSLMTVFICSCN